MSFDDYEKSVQDSAPVELYTFVTPTTTYRITSNYRDVTFGGNTFTAIPTSRSTIQIVDLHSDSYDASVEIPASHALAQAYANGVPPLQVSCLIQRYQPDSGLAIQLWFGYVNALNFKGRMASFRVPSGLADSLLMDCPSVIAQRLCNHVLYDARCSKVRADFQVSTTVTGISADARTITTAASVPAAINSVPWALHGELYLTPASDRRTIVAQPALNQFVLQCEFQENAIALGDAVVIYAGCDLTAKTCRDKFSNVINFGGHPDLPLSNVFYVGFLGARYGV